MCVRKGVGNKKAYFPDDYVLVSDIVIRKKLAIISPLSLGKKIIFWAGSAVLGGGPEGGHHAVTSSHVTQPEAVGGLKKKLAIVSPFLLCKKLTIAYHIC